MIEVKVDDILLDPISNLPILVLRSKDDSSLAMPVWIGAFEATQITKQMKNEQPEKPTIYDVFRDTMRSLGYELSMVSVDSIENGIYNVNLHFINNSMQEMIIPARLSDAVNLAIRCGAPLYVNEDLMTSDIEIKKKDNLDADFKKWIDTIRPDDFMRAP